jgi:hypothetical protein
MSKEIPFEWRRVRAKIEEDRPIAKIGAISEDSLAPAHPKKDSKSHTTTCQREHPYMDRYLVFQDKTNNEKENDIAVNVSYIVNAEKAQSAPSLVKQSHLLFSPSQPAKMREKSTPNTAKRVALSNIQNRLKTPSSEQQITKRQLVSLNPSSKRHLHPFSPCNQKSSNLKSIVEESVEKDRFSQMLEQPSQEDFSVTAPIVDPLCERLFNEAGLETCHTSSDCLRSVSILYQYFTDKGTLNPDDISTLAFLNNFIGILTDTLMRPIFEACKDIKIIDLSASYGENVHASLPFLTKSPNMDAFSRVCKLLYNSPELFEEIEFLDLTLVPFSDDLLRYIIRMSKLKGLGLAGSKVTVKGLRYLTKHATFVNNLEVLLLSGNDLITDDCLPYLSFFPNLKSLELVHTNVTYDGILANLVKFQYTDDGKKCLIELVNPHLTYLRLPDPIFRRLSQTHGLCESDLSLGYINFREKSLMDPISVEQLSLEECRAFLKVYKDADVYPSIYLNGILEDLRSRLKEIRIIRLKEEKIWSLL